MNYFDPNKVKFNVVPGNMIISYEGIGEDSIPKSLQNQLMDEWRKGVVRKLDYYKSLEFMKRCITHYEQETYISYE